MDPRLSVRAAAGVLLLLLASAPLLDLPSAGFDSLRRPWVLALLGAAWALATVWIARRREIRSDRDPAGFACALVAGVALLSWAVSGGRGEGFEPLVAALAGVGAWQAARRGPLPEGFGARLTAVLGLVGAALGAWGLAQAARGGPPAAGEGNTNYAGALAGALLPACLSALAGTSWASRAAGGAGSAGSLLLLAISRSRGGWVGALAGLLVWTLLSRRWKTGLVVGALLAGVPFLPGPESQLSAARLETARVRQGLWRGAGALFLERPVLGGGPGTFALDYPLHRDPVEAALSRRHLRPGDHKEAEDAHSSWMQAAAETGSLGLLAWLLVPWTAGRRLAFHARHSPDLRPLAAAAGGLGAAVLAAGAFNTLTLHLSPMILFWLLLGVADREGVAARPARRREAGQGTIARFAGGAALFLVLLVPALDVLVRDLALHAALREPSASARAPLLDAIRSSVPGMWRVHVERGRVYEALGRPAEAAGAYQEALRERPHLASAHLNLGVALIRAGGPRDEVEASLRRARQLAPDWFLPAYNLGGFLLLKDDLPGAEEALRDAVRLDPSHAGATFSLAEARWRSSRRPEGLAGFRKARELGMDVGGAMRQEHPAWVQDPDLAEFFR